jgi:hypothetical protein
MVNMSQNPDIPGVGSVFLKFNHLIHTIEHYGYLLLMMAVVLYFLGINA